MPAAELETCQGCAIKHPLTPDGRILGHVREYYGPCAGGLKRSREYVTRRKEEINAALLRRLERVKLDAQIAADAFQLGRPTYKLEPLIKLAISAQTWRYGPWPYRRYRLVRCETHSGKRGKGAAYKMDVYCRFCGGLLRAQLPSIAYPEAIDLVKRHTTLCALQCLAGQREMMPNHHKGFVDDDRRFE